jgi:hypothetical protein
MCNIKCKRVYKYKQGCDHLFLDHAVTPEASLLFLKSSSVLDDTVILVGLFMDVEIIIGLDFGFFISRQIA